MIYSRGKKEFVLSLFLKFYPEVLTELIGYKIVDLTLDKYVDGRKVDAYTKVNQRTVFIELQLNKSDSTHLNQIKSLIFSASYSKETTIVWIASEFNESMLNELENKILKAKKNIELIAVEFNDDIIKTLDILDNMYELDKIGNLRILNGKNHFKIIRRFYRESHDNKECQYSGNDNIKLPLTIMEEILKEISEQISYYPNVHRHKNPNIKVIIIGAGKNDMTYAIGINKENYIFIELRFTVNNRDMFLKLFGDGDELEEYFDYQIDWNLRKYKIFSEAFYEVGNHRIIKQQVRLLDKLIRYFTRYLNELDMEYQAIDFNVEKIK